MPKVLITSKQGEKFQYIVLGAICGEKKPDKIIYLHNDTADVYESNLRLKEKLIEWANEEIKGCRRQIFSDISVDALEPKVRIGSAEVVLSIIGEID